MIRDAESRTLDAVRMALAAHDVDHVRVGTSFSVPHGSTRVEIEVVEGAPAPTISVRATVLTDIRVDGPDVELLLLRRLNDLSANLRFGKFYFDAPQSRIVVEYEILGTHLQSEELLHALSVVAVLADDHDDVLMAQLGQGQRAVDVTGPIAVP